jgi:hypothetical protein
LVAVAADAKHLIAMTGCAAGPVRVSLAAHESAPAAPSQDDLWEAVEETSVQVASPLFWSSPDPGLDAPRQAAFTPIAPGPHSFRISAKGRARAYDLAITHAVEEFHVDVWPEPELREPQVLRKESAPF